MALEFKKLSEVTTTQTVSNSAKLLIEDGGEIKRVPKSVVGGSSGGADGIVTFTLFDSEYSCSHTFAEFAEMYDNLTLNMVYFRDLSEGRYYFDTVTRIDPYDSGGSIVNIGDTANNAEYFMINTSFQFFKDGSIAESAPV